jgi:hypothetical protein
MTEKTYGPDPNAPKHPDCVACQNDWPIFVNPRDGRREHIDLFATREYGVAEACPTTSPQWNVVDDCILLNRRHGHKDDCCFAEQKLEMCDCGRGFGDFNS